MSNTDQIEYWNGEAGRKWAEHAERLDAMLAPFIPAVLSAATLQPGERVLDVGCGAGALTLQAFAATGAAVGVDVSEPLVSLARKRAEAAGAAARFDVADAAAWRADEAMDALLSRFGVMFFEDPTAAFANLRRSMKPRGRLVFACWRTLPENDWAFAPLQAVLPLLTAPPEPPPPGAPGPFAFGDRTRIEDVLDAAGWADLQVEPWDGAIDLPAADAEAAARFMLKIGPTARMLDEAGVDPEAAVARLEALFGAHEGPAGGVRLAGAAWIVRARAS